MRFRPQGRLHDGSGGDSSTTMKTRNELLARLRHHVTGAIERGEKEAIVGQPVSKQLRIFVPANPDYMVIIQGRHTGVRGSVKRWVWTPRNGLMCHYKDGTKSKAGWTLPQLLKASKDGRETAIREVANPLDIF